MTAGDLELLYAYGAWANGKLMQCYFEVEMGRRAPRAEIPLNRSPEFNDEALLLRNKLLLFRFRNRGKLLLRVRAEERLYLVCPDVLSRRVKDESVDAEKCDLFDVLAHIAMPSRPCLARNVRVARRLSSRPSSRRSSRSSSTSSYRTT